MKKKLLALAVAVAMAAAVGCGATKTTEGKTVDRIKAYQGGGASVYVDRETGVEYMVVKNYGYGVGVTVLLNPDGTPKIARGYQERVTADEQ